VVLRCKRAVQNSQQLGCNLTWCGSRCGSATCNSTCNISFSIAVTWTYTIPCCPECSCLTALVQYCHHGMHASALHCWGCGGIATECLGKHLPCMTSTAAFCVIRDVLDTCRQLTVNTCWDDLCLDQCIIYFSDTHQVQGRGCGWVAVRPAQLAQQPHQQGCQVG
jgi:hypothetical protein